MLKKILINVYRHMASNRTNTILNISGLALGIAVCLIITIWLRRELSFDNFHPNGKQIFRLTNTFKSESESFSQAPSGTAFGAHLSNLLPAVKSACRIFPETFKLKANNQQFIESNSIAADPGFFNFFGFKLIKGDPSQVLLSHDRVVLTEKLATKYFGYENPVGKTILLGGEHIMTISGVAQDPPVNSHIQFDLVISSAFIKRVAKEQYQFDIDEMWVGGWPFTYVQLNNADKWKETENDINRVAVKFSAKEWKENKMSYQYHLQPLKDIHLKSHLRYDANNNGSLSSVNIFSIVGIIVLLLACINYVNLTTACAIKRAKEISVRKVVGATRTQLVKQFFFETLILCMLAVLAGLVLVTLVLPYFSTFIGQPYNFAPSAINALIVAGLIIIISAIAGIYPAIILSSFKPAVALKGNFVQSAKGNFFRQSLVVFQFTITIALVSSILVISRQMNYIKNKSLGFEGNAVIEVKFFGDPGVIKQYSSLRNELLKSPYILNVSKHNQNIVGGLGNGWTTTENLKGDEISTSLYQLSVDTTYLETYSMQLSAGRFFSKDVPTDTIRSVLVNEAAVKTFGWQKPVNAIGKRFGKGDETKYVIGVVKDFNFESLHKPVEALMIGYAKNGNSLSLKVNATHTSEAISHLEKTWKKAVPELPLQFSFVDEEINKQYGNEQKLQGIFFGFASFSLLIACLGLFGLTLFVVERKIKEIGVRKVLGANVTGIVSLLSKDFLKLIVIATFIATPVAYYLMHEWLQDFSYRINIGFWVFVAAGMIALLIALGTISIQAIKAAIANPVKSLRTE